MADERDDGKSSKPLSGVILCCTSIPAEQRSEVATCAEQMGAVHKLDLTSDVTHLIVGNSNTAKYRYVAKERPDVVVLKLDWIEAIRELWIHGEDIDTRELEEQYRRPVFADLQISLTGFDDVEQRQRLQRLVKENGAEYHGNLVKHVTHLVAHRTDGEKYRHAHLWGLKVVSLEWLVESVERGMVLDEALYDPKLPREERGKNAWVRSAPVAMALGKRPRQEGSASGNPGDPGNGRRKLRRTASTKLQTQNSELWTDIVGGGFDKKAVVMDTRVDQDEGEQQAISRPDATNPPDAGDSNAEFNRLGDSRMSVGSEVAAAAETYDDGLFGNGLFYIHGFESKKTRVLQGHICAQGGHVLSTFQDLKDAAQASPLRKIYVLVPHDTSSDEAKLDAPELDSRIIWVSEWWVERCLHRKAMTDPEKDVCSRPLGRNPISGFDQLTVCSTGFNGVDLLHLSKVVQLMGGKYEEFMTPQASVLICNSPLPNRGKVNHALHWRIPCVEVQWLWDGIERREKMSFDRYLRPESMNSMSTSALPRNPSPSSRILNHNKHNDQLPTLPPVSRQDAITGEQEIQRHDDMPTTFSKSTTATTANGVPRLPPRELARTKSTSDMTSHAFNSHQQSKPKPNEDLNAAITALLARKQLGIIPPNVSSNPERNNTTNNNNPPLPSTGGRKPPSRLGSAPSNLSSSSTSVLPPLPTEDPNTSNKINDVLNPENDIQPSTQRLLYEDPEVQAQREKVLRKIRGPEAISLMEKEREGDIGPVRRAKSTTVAKDAGGVGSRTRLKTGGVVA